MLCEECNVNEASVLITMLVQDDKRTKYLCQDCVDKLKEDFQQGDVVSFLSSLMSLMPKAEPIETLQCSSCHLTYEIFQKTGKLGCAQCYKDFEKQLQPLLRRVHGRTQHAGRVPAQFKQEAIRQTQENPPEQTPQQKKEEALRLKMEQAISEENFEQAAVLRDQLKELTKRVEAKND